MHNSGNTISRRSDLVVFDVDGTLVDSMELDGLCFVRAVGEVLGIDRIDTDWSTYPDTTDAAILDHIHQVAFGRLPDKRLVERVRARFVALLDESIRANPSACRPILGGPGLIRHLTASTGCAVAIATGGWHESARIKLAAAGYPVSDIPMASSNDARFRVDILSIAAERAAARVDARSFDRITYVGDGVWDLRAATLLGYEFVGVGHGTDSRLSAEGCRLVPDLSDADHLLRLFTERGA